MIEEESEFPEDQKIILLIKSGQKHRNEWKGKVKRMTRGIRQMNFSTRRVTEKAV